MYDHSVAVPRAKRRIERQVAPALAMVMEADGSADEWLALALADGERRWSRLQREAIARARAGG